MIIIPENKTVELPELNSIRRLAGVCEFISEKGKKYLYVFGGMNIQPDDSTEGEESSIERLNLSDGSKG